MTDAPDLLSRVSVHCEQCGEAFQFRQHGEGERKPFSPDKCHAAIHPEGARASGGGGLPAVVSISEPESTTSELVEDDKPFDWHGDDAVLIPRQAPVACYFNKRSELVIRQRAEWYDEDDSFIFLAPENIGNFIDKLYDLAGIPRIGRGHG